MNANSPHLKKVRGKHREITCSMVAEAKRLEEIAIHEDYVWQLRGQALSEIICEVLGCNCPYCGR